MLQRDYMRTRRSPRWGVHCSLLASRWSGRREKAKISDVLSTAAIDVKQPINMALIKRLQKLGGSVALVLPKAVAQAADMRAGERVRLRVEGRRLVVEPELGATESLPDDAFEAAKNRVLERYGETFHLLAEHDRRRR